MYDHGVLRPLEPLELAEAQRVRLIIAANEPGSSEHDLNLTDHVRREAATLTIAPTIEEVRTALSSIPGSLSEDVVAERGDYWLARYFFDTSALVKYYYAEKGTPEVTAIFAEASRTIRFRAWVPWSPSRVCNEGSLWRVGSKSSGIQRARFLLDIAAGDIELHSLTVDHLVLAERLIGRHGFAHRLRTLDALPASVHRHKLPDGYRVASTSILGGLHHEYRLREGGSLASYGFFAEHSLDPQIRQQIPRFRICDHGCD